MKKASFETNKIFTTDRLHNDDLLDAQHKEHFHRMHQSMQFALAMPAHFHYHSYYRQRQLVQTTLLTAHHYFCFHQQHILVQTTVPTAHHYFCFHQQHNAHLGYYSSCSE